MTAFSPHLPLLDRYIDPVLNPKVVQDILIAQGARSAVPFSLWKEDGTPTLWAISSWDFHNEPEDFSVFRAIYVINEQSLNGFYFLFREY